MDAIQVDSFLPAASFTRLRKHCDELDYAGVTSPADGVFYPGVSLDIPEDIKADVLKRVALLHGLNEIAPNFTFMRLSVEGVKAPHIAHCDRIMGDWAFFLYLNRKKDARGGTSLVRHRGGGFDRTPLTPRQVGYVVRDQNRPECWEVTRTFDMVPNRGVAVPSTMFHWAEPHEGFGAGAKDGRLVLIVFYKLED